MGRKLLLVVLAAVVVLSVAFLGCKAKVEKTEAEQLMGQEVVSTTLTESDIAVVEPYQNIASETIPPTAAPQIAPPAAGVVPLDQLSRNKEIQTALAKAGYYTGAIDGKVGPKTKAAIKQFQQARGLKVDGKVGPKTWAELVKFLTQ